MYKLTEIRMNAANDILEKYRTWLYSQGRFHAGSLEGELRRCWDVGFRELKDIVKDMFKNNLRLKYVAAYYMQNRDCPGPNDSFKTTLADLYHLRNYDSPDREHLQKM